MVAVEGKGVARLLWARVPRIMPIMRLLRRVSSPLLARRRFSGREVLSDWADVGVGVGLVSSGVGDDNDGSFMVVSVSGTVVSVLSMLSVMMLGFDTAVSVDCVVMVELERGLRSTNRENC